MKIIYMGTPDLAVMCLDALHQSRHRILSVVTQPDRPRGRGRILTASPVKRKTLELGLPLLQPPSLAEAGFHEKLRSYEADLLVVVAFSILPDSLLSLCPHGAVNLHGSLLPRYRGAAPIQWAIAKGETVSGVTLFQLDSKIDHGKILRRDTLPIGPDETAGEYGKRLLEMGKGSLTETLDALEKGEIQPIAQDHSQASYAPKLRKEDGRIDWSLPAQTIHNRVRGFNPYPVCYTGQEGTPKVLRILRSSPTTLGSRGPGAVMMHPEAGLLAGCGDVMLQILEVQPEGKSPMRGLDYWNGLTFRENLKFINL